MKAIFGYTFSQLRYVVSFKTIDHSSLILLEFEQNAMSRDTRWRHDCVTTLGTTSPMALCICQILAKTKFVQWPKWRSENPCTKSMGFWRQEEEEKKNQNKSNTFSAALEAAEKLKKKTEQKESLFRCARKSQKQNKKNAFFAAR